MGQLELKLTRANFATWLHNTFISQFGGGEVVVGVPHSLAKEWLEKRCFKDIVLALEEITSAPVRSLSCRVEAKPSNLAPIMISVPGGMVNTGGNDGYGFTTTESMEQAPPSGNITLNNNYSFQTFVVGKQNELAHAASQAVSSHPGGTYNPLFIYGGVGLGKTHLLHAIANEIKRRNQNHRIMYVTCEHFTNDFIHSIRIGKGKEFKDRYRNVDLLLIDDVQFITGKEGTQEEFFHTFNTLHQANRQIVMTADRMPKEIGDLEDRLVSRIGWGMVADIQTPNFENRVAILQAKAKQMNFDAPPEVLEYIANTITNNIRELEGSLTKLATTATVEKRPVTVGLVKEVMKDLARPSGRHLTTKQIIRVVADHFAIDLIDLMGQKRVREIVYPRQIVMYLLRYLLKHSHPQIGDELGGKDHTTIMHGVKKIERLLKSDHQVERDVANIKRLLEVGG